MTLSEPFLKKRIDKSKPIQNNLFENPVNFFKNYNKTSVHFGYYNNFFTAIKLLVCDELITNTINYSSFIKSLNELYPNQDYLKEFYFYKRHNINFEILIIYDQVNWNLENNYLLSVEFDSEMLSSSDQTKAIRIIPQKDYQKRLVNLFGINRTHKPLIYSTSEFEGYLSDISISTCNRNDITLFPGDVDLITFDNNFNVSGLYEFKKHTKYGDGEIEDQSFMKYFQHDRKKYQGLALLAKQLKKEFFYNFIYSTKLGEEKKVKIEKIGNHLNLIQDIIYTYKKVEDIIKDIHLII